MEDEARVLDDSADEGAKEGHIAPLIEEVVAKYHVIRGMNHAEDRLLNDSDATRANVFADVLDDTPAGLALALGGWPLLLLGIALGVVIAHEENENV